MYKLSLIEGKIQMFHKQRSNFVVMISTVLLTTFIGAGESFAFDEDDFPRSNPHIRKEGSPSDAETFSAASTPPVLTGNTAGINFLPLTGSVTTTENRPHGSAWEALTPFMVRQNLVGTLILQGTNTYIGSTNISGATFSSRQSNSNSEI